MSLTNDIAPPSGRKPDAERTRKDILAVARSEFVEHGLSGARVDAIAERTQTTKRMIYYYFGSKEGLYSAVLEDAYSDIRAIEAGLALDDLDPETALRTLIHAMFDYEDAHPDFVRLIAIENIHQATYLSRLPTISAGQRRGDRVAADDPDAGACGRGVPARGGCRRHPSDDQRAVLLPGVQPAHVRGAVRPRPERDRGAKSPPDDDRRHGRGVPAVRLMRSNAEGGVAALARQVSEHRCDRSRGSPVRSHGSDRREGIAVQQQNRRRIPRPSLAAEYAGAAIFGAMIGSGGRDGADRRLAHEQHGRRTGGCRLFHHRPGLLRTSPRAF